MKRTLLAIIFILQLATTYAQHYPEREGFSIGGSIGGGVLHFTSGFEDNQTTGDLALPNLKLGWMVKDNLGLYLNLPGQIYKENGKDRSFEGLIPSVQYWPGNRFWLSGGFGVAMDFPAFYEVKNINDETWNWGKGALIGMGFEVLQRKKFTIDIQARMLMSSFKVNDGRKEGANFSMAVGFNYY
ncbi:MAG: hypothetical protein RIC06_21670 [Cyclobacteriaceae bacterium]